MSAGILLLERLLLMAFEHAHKEKVYGDLYTHRCSTPASLKLVAVGKCFILHCRRTLSCCLIYVEPYMMESSKLGA